MFADRWPWLSPSEVRDLPHRLLTRGDAIDEAITLQLDPSHLRDHLLGLEPEAGEAVSPPA